MSVSGSLKFWVFGLYNGVLFKRITGHKHVHCWSMLFLNNFLCCILFPLWFVFLKKISFSSIVTVFLTECKLFIHDHVIILFINIINLDIQYKYFLTVHGQDYSSYYYIFSYANNLTGHFIIRRNLMTRRQVSTIGVIYLISVN